jgi:hypothetical protein
MFGTKRRTVAREGRVRRSTSSRAKTGSARAQRAARGLRARSVRLCILDRSLYFGWLPVAWAASRHLGRSEVSDGVGSWLEISADCRSIRISGFETR